MDTTVIIKTLGRRTLGAAIESATREGFESIVVSDGAEVSAQGASQVVTLGRKWGYYGGMAANVGAALASTPFITFLDDDDEFIVGAGDIIRSKLKEHPEVDVWCAGVRFKEKIDLYNTATGELLKSTHDLSVDPSGGINPGNVAMPTYRTEIFAKVPFSNNLPDEVLTMTDYFHIDYCEKVGYKVAWFEEVLYLVRPLYDDSNGRGE